MKKVSYKAPLCITLFGDTVASYGKPTIMVAIDSYVEASTVEEEQNHDEKTKSILLLVAKELAVPKSVLKNIRVQSEYSLDYPAVQAACIVAVVATVLSFTNKTKPGLQIVQQNSYSIERKFFKNSSHAQTVTSVQGGLIFYRKEFEFYKTVMKLPMKLPIDFLVGIGLTTPQKITERIPTFKQDILIEAEKRMKRAVMAIQTESFNEWKQLIEEELIVSSPHDLHMSFKTSKNNRPITEAQIGLQSA